MKTYRGEGRTIYITAPYDLSSGDGIVVGSLFGFVGADASAGDQVALWILGEFAVTTKNETVTAGATAYWNDSSKYVEKTNTSGNVAIGKYVTTNASAATSATIVLTP